MAREVARLIRRSLFVLLINLVVLTAATAADSSVTVDNVLSETGARLQWDAARQVGVFWKGYTRISFRYGTGYAVVNDRDIMPLESTVRPDGTLVFDASSAAALRARLIPQADQERRRISAIFIDPGHGGRDPGTIGRHKVAGELLEIQEKDIVLDVSLRLRELLQASFPDRDIVMSRKDDVYLTLDQRTDLANAIQTGGNENVLFVSIHANASLNSRASGVEVWYLTPEFRRPGLIDAERVGVSDSEVLSILNTMREEEITIESVLLARSILSSIYSEVGNQSPNRGLKKEAWYVVREAKMPSVLVELGFVTNREEALRLADEHYLQRLAHGIYNGIVQFISGFEE